MVVKQGITNGSRCPRCHQSVGQEHGMGCSEAEMQAAAACRPPNFAHLSGERQWEIDKGLGCLDWEGY